MAVGDIGTVRLYDPQGLVGTGTPINVQISLNGTEILSEQYDTVDSEIYIRNLRKVLLDNWPDPEFKFENNTLINGYRVRLFISKPGSSGGGTFHIYTLRYSTLRMNGAEIVDRFLCRYLEKEVTPDSIEMIAISPLYVKVISLEVAYIRDGEVFYIQDKDRFPIQDSEENLCYQFKLSFRECLETYTADNLIYIRVRALNSDQEEVDRIVFNVTELDPLLISSYIYRNPFGIPEVFTFWGRVTENFDPRSELAYTQDGYRKVNDDPLETYKVRTGALTTERRESVKDLLRSYEVYELKDGEIGERMTVIETEAERTFPSNSITNYTLTFQKAGYNTDEFTRGEFSGMRIFDKTFDYTFE